MAQPTQPNQPGRDTQTSSGRDDRRDQQFGPASTPSQRPAGSRSSTDDMSEDEESLEPVEHYRKGENEADADIERPSESSTSSTRKINR